jgi:hypothetical protein
MAFNAAIKERSANRNPQKSCERQARQAKQKQAAAGDRRERTFGVADVDF